MALHRPRQDSCHIPEEALELIFNFIDDIDDRFSISLVCKKWHAVDKITRKHVTVAFTYAVRPAFLTRRFRGLQSLKLKGKPRADMFDLLPENWGGYAEPWIREISVNCPCLVSLHLRRMVVTDEDLLTLATRRRHMLQVLKLDKCSGFSTIGLEAIARHCRSLRVLCLNESIVDEHNGNWLHELVLNNSSLEHLSFFPSNLTVFDTLDLETLAMTCKSLRSLRVNDVDFNNLSRVLEKAVNLKELGGLSLSDSDDVADGHCSKVLSLPKGLTSLVGLMYLGEVGDYDVQSLVQPLAPNLKSLDLQLAALSVDGHCQLLCHCTNLETLEVLNGIGDEGLDIVARHCKQLRRLRVESGDREFQQGYVTQKGLISIAKGCADLEYIAIYISNIDNAALVAVGEHCPKMKDFRIVLLADDNCVPEFPLDHGVRALMQGCPRMRRLALYLRPGSLSDAGMGFIGKYGCNLRWALLGLVGETNAGLKLLADGCPKLEKLEMRDCIFTEAGISSAVLNLRALKYIWVQGYEATSDGRGLFAMRRIPFWNIEFVPDGLPNAVDGAAKKTAQFLAYHSLVGPRTDHPETIVCLA